MNPKMLEPFVAEGDERILCQVECEYLHGSTYHDGILTLSSERLHFTRQDQETPLVWDCKLTMVLGASVDIARASVTFQLHLVDHCFRGEGAIHLHVVFAREYWRITKAAVEEEVAPGEHLLLEGVVEIFREDVLESTGNLVLTSRFLRFESAEGEPSFSLEEPVAAISKLNIEGAQRRLEIVAGDARYRLEGDVIPRLFGILRALREDEGIQHGASSFTTWRAGMYRGPLVQYGELVCSATTCRFTSAGKLDAFLGLNRNIEFTIDDLVSVEVRGVLERKLYVRTDERIHAFKLPNASERFAAFRELVTDVGAGLSSELPGKSASQTLASSFLPSWGDLVGEIDIDSVLYFTPAWCLVDSDLAYFGHICLTQAFAYFVPQGRRMVKEDVICLKTDRLLPPGPGQFPIGEILLSDGGDAYRFSFGRGDASTASFWAAWAEEMDRTGKGVFHPALKPDADNRRESFRATTIDGAGTYIYVGTDGPTQAPEAVKGDFTDLSIGGCSIVTNSNLPSGLRVRVEMPAVGRDRTVDAQVMHSSEVGESNEEWRHGIRFLDLSEEETARVHASVMALQRNSLSRLADLRDQVKNPD